MERVIKTEIKRQCERGRAKLGTKDGTPEGNVSVRVLMHVYACMFLCLCATLQNPCKTAGCLIQFFRFSPSPSLPSFFHPILFQNRLGCNELKTIASYN